MVLIEGARGSGKDVTAHQTVREMSRCQTCKVSTYLKPIYINLEPKKYHLPHYFKKWDRKFRNNSVLYLTDAHLEYYSMEWATKKASTLIKLMNISRHKNIDMVWTTLLASDIPRGVVKRMDASIYKEPIFRAERYERYELRDEVMEAKTFFEGKTKKEKWETALVFTQKGKFKVQGIKKPFYWSEELSKAHMGYEFEKQPTTIFKYE